MAESEAFVTWADDLATEHTSRVVSRDGDYLNVDCPDPNNPGVMVTTLHRSEVAVVGCASCGEVEDQDECPKSERLCGHHCNHVWEQDICDWCGWAFILTDEDGE